MSAITREKLGQAVGLVAGSEADVWVTFVRETSLSGDPVLPLILEPGLTWLSALIVAGNGRKIAVVGNYDAHSVELSGDWDEVVPYVQGIRTELLNQLEALVSPGGKIAVNYSLSDRNSDGLSHGMYVLLAQYLEGTRFEGSLVSAEPIVMSLRGVKSAAEVSRIKGAIAETYLLFDEIANFARAGVTEKAVQEMVHQKISERGLGFAWDPSGDPIVNSGPNSAIGHGAPSPDITIQPGHVFHIDLGVQKDGYSSDIQRCWYVPDGSPEIPEDLHRVLAAVTGAISAGAAALKPGAMGYEVDAAARSFLVGCGYDEYLHAFGHQVGRVAHDGGAVLGPRWERYGRTPTIPIKLGEVYTLELGVITPNRGYFGLEEMAVVTKDGLEWLTDRQLTIPLLR